MPLTYLLKSAQITATGVALMLAFASAGLCQTESGEASESTPSDAQEEITVYGQKTVFKLRQEFYDAQENFFDVFNTLNSDDMLNINCRYVTPLGTRRRSLECTPKFVRFYEPLPGAAWDMMMDTRHYEDAALRGKMKEKNDLLWKEMAELVSDSPEMQKALSKLAKAKGDYESRRQE